MTPDTATNQECRDYIAECEGWTYDPTDDPFPMWIGPDGDLRWFGCRHGDHPLDDTLDAAYASLPPGWRWDSIYFESDGARTFAVGPNDEGVGQLHGDHKLALLRTACKAWAVVRGKDGKA